MRRETCVHTENEENTFWEIHGREEVVFSLRTWNAVFVVSDTDFMHEEKSNVEALASPYG